MVQSMRPGLNELNTSIRWSFYGPRIVEVVSAVIEVRRFLKNCHMEFLLLWTVYDVHGGRNFILTSLPS